MHPCFLWWKKAISFTTRQKSYLSSQLVLEGSLLHKHIYFSTGKNLYKGYTGGTRKGEKVTEAKKYLESHHVLIRSDRTDVQYRRVACIRQLNDACHGINFW